jgi:PTS system sucrose-specific IIC component
MVISFIVAFVTTIILAKRAAKKEQAAEKAS